MGDLSKVGQDAKEHKPCSVRGLQPSDIPACEQLLARLPNWFGLEAQNRAYVESLQTFPAAVAEREGEYAGFLALEHGLSYNIRMAYRPSIFSDNQVGILVGWNDINVDSESGPNLADLNDIEQLTVGVFGDWHWDKLRVLANVVHFENELNYTMQSVDDVFVAGYLQVEYKTGDDWTLFGRVDASSSEDTSPYLRLLPAYVSHRHMLGVRWDFIDSHSLTMEVADTSTHGDGLTHDNFKEVRFQWSSVFP